MSIKHPFRGAGIHSHTLGWLKRGQWGGKYSSPIEFLANWSCLTAPNVSLLYSSMGNMMDLTCSSAPSQKLLVVQLLSQVPHRRKRTPCDLLVSKPASGNSVQPGPSSHHRPEVNSPRSTRPERGGMVEVNRETPSGAMFSSTQTATTSNRTNLQPLYFDPIVSYMSKKCRLASAQTSIERQSVAQCSIHS